MANQIILPKMGQTVEEGTIVKWLVAEGDTVDKGQALFELETDKAVLEVESTASGVVRRILVAEGETVPVLAPVAIVGTADEAIPEALLGVGPPAPAPPEPSRVATAVAQAPATVTAPVAPGASVPAAAPARAFSSPRARKAAAEAGVDLARLTGTGQGGRVRERDVLAYAQNVAAVKAQPLARKLAGQHGVDLTTVAGTGPRGKVTGQDVLAAAQSGAAAPGPVAGAREVAPSAMRRIVAQRMTLSKTTIPHFYLVMDVDMAALVQLRGELNSTGQTKLSYNDFIIKAVGIAMAELPAVNRAWQGDTLLAKDSVDIGLAVALEEGLIVPVVRQVERKTLSRIAAESARLVQRARSKQLTPDEYQGGSFTVSNVGMFGMTAVLAIINPGESAILGLGEIQQRVVASEGMIAVRPMMTATLSADHRIIDGAVGAQFMQRLKQLLEEPSVLLR